MLFLTKTNDGMVQKQVEYADPKTFTIIKLDSPRVNSDHLDSLEVNSVQPDIDGVNPKIPDNSHVKSVNPETDPYTLT
ncbi:hypothetical protein LXL04_028830 [Taraxacum kok-saghyz]